MHFAVPPALPFQELETSAGSSSVPASSKQKALHRPIELLCMETFRALAFRFVKLDSAVDKAAQKRRLRFLIQTIKILTAAKQPRPLDAAVRRMFYLMKSKYRLLFQMACKNLLVGRNMRRAHVQSLSERKGEEFMDLQPWEVFLSNGGRCNHIQPTIPRTVGQVVPLNAMNIPGEMTTYEQSVKDHLLEVSCFSRSNKRTTISDLCRTARLPRLSRRESDHYQNALDGKD